MKDLNKNNRREELRKRYSHEAKQDLILYIILIIASLFLALSILKIAQINFDKWSLRTCSNYNDCEEVKEAINK